MAKKIIDLSGIGGLCDNFWGEFPYSSAKPNLRYLGKDNQYVGGIVNPLASPGYLSPANNTFRAVTGAPTSIVGSTKYDSVSGRMYFFERGTKLYELQGGLDDVAFDTSRTITGAVGTDLAIYQINGVRKLFYPYRKSGGGNIGIHDFITTFDDTWLSATASGAFNTGQSNNVKVILSDNGYAYILDGSSLHKIDGTTYGGANGTVTANVLLFPANYQLIDAVDTRGMMWISITQTTNDIEVTTTDTARFSEGCGVYVWDRQSTISKSIDYISIDGAKEARHIFTFRGIPYIFTVSSDGYTQLRAYNGNEFKILKTLGLSAHPVYKSSISVTGNCIKWLGKDGKFYIYGKITDSQDSDNLYIIGDISGAITGGQTFVAGGAILCAGKDETTSTGLNASPEAFYMSVLDNSTNLVKKWYPHSKSIYGASQYANTGSFYSNVILLPKLSKIKGITIVFPQLSLSGTTQLLTVKTYLNQSTTESSSTTFTYNDAARGYKFIPLAKTGVNSFQLGITFATDIGMANIITPMYAELEYDTTKKEL